jgi:hypothetical protein
MVVVMVGTLKRLIALGGKKEDKRLVERKKNEVGPKDATSRRNV